MKEKLAQNEKNQEKTVVLGPWPLSSYWVCASRIQEEVRGRFYGRRMRNRASPVRSFCETRLCYHPVRFFNPVGAVYIALNSPEITVIFPPFCNAEICREENGINLNGLARSLVWEPWGVAGRPQKVQHEKNKNQKQTAIWSPEGRPRVAESERNEVMREAKWRRTVIGRLLRQAHGPSSESQSHRADGFGHRRAQLDCGMSCDTIYPLFQSSCFTVWALFLIIDNCCECCLADFVCFNFQHLFTHILDCNNVKMIINVYFHRFCRNLRE